MIRLCHHHTFRNFEAQGATSSHPRDAKCRRRRVLGPQYCRDDQGRPIREGHVVHD
jgi:hypothetical protein